MNLQKQKDANASSVSTDPQKDSPGEKRASRRRKKAAGKGEIIRAEQLEKLLESGEEIDPEAIISMYRPRRKAKILGAALLRLDKLHLLALAMLVLVGVLFLLSFAQEKMGNFTINLNRLELYRKGISIASDGEFTNPTARLTASAIAEATNISIDDLPDDLDEIDGDHNGENYMAYTYYVRNAGKVDVAYTANVVMESCSKGAEEAVRIAIWRNGERVVYAEPSATGEPEEDCVNFLSRNLVCTYEEDEFLVGYVDKYTIVIWLEGDDPECIDPIVGGSVQFRMDIKASGRDDSPLLVKYIQDIVDTLKDDKPISAAGNEAPDFTYTDREITWQTRRNQGRQSTDATSDSASQPEQDNNQAASTESKNIHTMAYSTYEIDSKLRIVQVDDQFEAITGYTREDVEAQQLTQAMLMFEEDLSEYLAMLEQTSDDDSDFYVEHRLRCKDGTVIRVYSYGHIYFDLETLQKQIRILMINALDPYQK